MEIIVFPALCISELGLDRDIFEIIQVTVMYRLDWEPKYHNTPLNQKTEKTLHNLDPSLISLTLSLLIFIPTLRFLVTMSISFLENTIHAPPSEPLLWLFTTPAVLVISVKTCSHKFTRTAYFLIWEGVINSVKKLVSYWIILYSLLLFILPFRIWWERTQKFLGCETAEKCYFKKQALK